MADDPIIKCRPVENMEHRKFESDGSGGVRVKTSVTGDITGEFSTTGLSNDFLITTDTIGTSAIKIPLSPLTARNAMSIHNLSSQVLYIGKSDVVSGEADGTTAGWELAAGGFLQLDITDAIEIYGVVASGTAKIKIFEVS